MLTEQEVQAVEERLRKGYGDRGYDQMFPPGDVFVCRRCGSGSIAPKVDPEAPRTRIVGAACPACAKPGEETAEYQAWRVCRTGTSFSLRPPRWKIHGTQTGRWPFVG